MKFILLLVILSLSACTLTMELQEPHSSPSKPDTVISFDLNQTDDAMSETMFRKVSSDDFSVALIKNIRLGKIAHIHEMLRRPVIRSEATASPTGLSELTSALGYTQGELALQQSQMAQKVLDTFYTRYKQTLLPLGLTFLCLVNIGTNAYSFATGVSNASLQNTTATTDTQQTSYSFGINMGASILAVIGFGYESGLQIRKGWTDHRQKKLVEQLKNSELFLKLLMASALKDGVISPTEQAAIDTAHIQNVQLQVQLAQATVAAQSASAAVNNLAFKAPEVQTQTPVTRTKVVKKKRRKKPVVTGQNGAEPLQ